MFGEDQRLRDDVHAARAAPRRDWDAGASRAYGEPRPRRARFAS